MPKPIPDFDFPVTIETGFSGNNIPFMAQEIASVNEGMFKGTDVLIGPRGLMAYLVIDGKAYGHIGFSYNDWLKQAALYARNKIIEIERSVPEAIGL